MIYQKEMLEASETAKALVEGMKNTASDFTTATHVEHVKAMFKVNKYQLTNINSDPLPPSLTGVLDAILSSIQCSSEGW